jgi:hypothetical protein
MGDAARIRKLMDEMLPGLPDPADAAGLIREKNYQKLVLMVQDIEKVHGTLGSTCFMQMIEYAYPDDYAQYQKDLKTSKDNIRTHLQFSIEQQPKQRRSFTNDQLKLLLIPQPDQSAVNVMTVMFFDTTNYVDVGAFANWADGDPEIPSNDCPDSWPSIMKLASTYEPLQAYVAEILQLLPEEKRIQSMVAGAVHTNLVRALCIAATRYINKRDAEDD